MKILINYVPFLYNYVHEKTLTNTILCSYVIKP